MLHEDFNTACRLLHEMASHPDLQPEHVPTHPFKYADLSPIDRSMERDVCVQQGSSQPSVRVFPRRSLVSLSNLADLG